MVEMKKLELKPSEENLIKILEDNILKRNIKITAVYNFFSTLQLMQPQQLPKPAYTRPELSSLNFFCSLGLRDQSINKYFTLYLPA